MTLFGMIMRRAIRRFWFGTALALVSAAVSAMYSLFGPLPAGFNWAGLVVVVVVVEMAALALFANYGRNPNPFLRTYPHDQMDLPPLYDLHNLPPEPPTLDSRAADVLWNLLPLGLVALALARFVAKF